MRICNDSLCDQVKADMRQRIAELEAKVAVVDKLFANEIDPNIQIALVRREQWFPANDTLMREAGYLGEGE
jgi:hypothetical protein